MVILTGKKYFLMNQKLLSKHDTLLDHSQNVMRVRKKTSLLNIRMQNRMMQLRKCVNHPYLLEFPLTSNGDFKIDEELVTSSGKILLLDRMLPPLLRDGHKVVTPHACARGKVISLCSFVCCRRHPSPQNCRFGKSRHIRD